MKINKRFISLMVVLSLFCTVVAVKAMSIEGTPDEMKEFVSCNCNEEALGGQFENRVIDFSEGISVDGTVVIDGDGNFDGAVTGTTATLSSTLDVTGVSTVSKFVQGGATETLSTTSATALLLTATQICADSYIASDPNGASSTLTTPTAAQMIAACIPTAGDSTTIHFENTADAAENYTVTAGNAIDLIEPSGGDVIIAQNEDATIQFLNVNGTAVKAIVTSLQAAD